MPGAFLILTEDASFRRAVRRKSLISLICLGCIGQRHASNTDGVRSDASRRSVPHTRGIRTLDALSPPPRPRPHYHTVRSLYQRVRAALSRTKHRGEYHCSTLARACFFSLSQKHFYFGEHPVNFTTTLRASRLGKRGLRQIVGGAARGGVMHGKVVVLASVFAAACCGLRTWADWPGQRPRSPRAES